ncbi:MAG: hypothetical protein BWY40_00883 [bacterium ADurb.Bin270]|nr:MAG: hypothetical protein BWY40_00883 [bacterium ADurb.Bin270]
MSRYRCKSLIVKETLSAGVFMRFVKLHENRLSEAYSYIRRIIFRFNVLQISFLQEKVGSSPSICYSALMSIQKKGMDISLAPIENEVRNLLDLFEFFLTERHLGKSIEALGEIVRDMRIVIGRIMSDYFIRLRPEDEVKFCTSLAVMLAERGQLIPFEDDGEYVDYCIGEILTAFEYAQEIKESYPEDKILQKILALDIPVLRPFDYGLRGKLKLIEKNKKRRLHN